MIMIEQLLLDRAARANVRAARIGRDKQFDRQAPLNVFAPVM